MQSTNELYSAVPFPLEKEQLFRLLEEFFGNCENDPVIDELFASYVLAKKCGTNESYKDLLEKIYFSSLEIPGLIVSYGYVGDGYSFKVDFTNRPRDEDEKEGFNTLQKKDDDTNPVVSLSQQVDDDRSGHLHKFYCDELENIRKEVNELKSHTLRKERPDEEDDEIFNTKDSYSFIMVRPLSFAAFVGIMIFLIQVSSSVLAVSNQFLSSDKAPFKNKPFLIVPRGVDRAVHAGQGIALFLVILVQEGLWESALNLSNGYGRSMKEQGIIKGWWYIANILRFTEGLVATTVTFILIVESDDVVALFKDFTAITFVSSFDNIVYALAGMDVIGKYMKKTFEDCELVSEKRNVAAGPIRGSSHQFFKQMRTLLFHPSVLVLSLLIIMYALWLHTLLLPHLSGSYLCQKLFIQLDDDVNSELSFHSGTYELLGAGERRGAYHGYREVKKSLRCKGCENRKPLVLIYCQNKGYWVFALEDSSKRECDLPEKEHLVKSELTDGESKFDVFEVGDGWEVYDDRYMPLEDFVVRCQDLKPQYPIVAVDQVCKKVQRDERTPAFVGARKWAETFEKAHDGEKPITVYNHPVFQFKNSFDDFDLLMFMGKRWAILSSTRLEHFVCNNIKTSVDCSEENYAKKLYTYLQEEFHGRWSEYTVGFFSDVVVLRSPKDTLSPVDISWLKPTVKVPEELQAADEKRKVTSSFLCAKCDKDENPCFFEGNCQPSADCYCTKGSLGVLCQVVPIKNGVCDSYFNKREFDFDGGDCCKQTCVSSATQRCGFDRTGEFVTEYDVCNNDTSSAECENGLCFAKIFPLSFHNLIVGHVSISARGKSIALIESGGRTVRVYDSDGSNWNMRGSAITNVISPSSSSIQIAAYDFMANKINPDRFYPVTVALKSEGSLKLYHWMNNFWEETFTGIEFNRSKHEVTDFTLLNNGNSLGLFLVDGSYQFFHRENYYKPWKETTRTRRSSFQHSASSDIGNRFIFADQYCLSVHDKYNITAKECLDRKITKINLSRNGNYAAVLQDLGFGNGNIQLFNVSDGGITSIYSNLRGVSSELSMMSVSNHGDEFSVASTRDSKLKLFMWNGTTWFEVVERQIHSMVSMSDWDYGTYATIAKRKTVSAGEVNTLALFFEPNIASFICGEAGEHVYRFTIMLDDYPEETIWQIQFEDDAKMIQSSMYAEKQMTVTENICLKKNDCVNLAIFDTRGNGIIDNDNKNYAGFSFKNDMKQKVNGTFGFEKIIGIEGFKSCPKIDRPWKILQLHKDCSNNTCSWNQIGDTLTGQREGDGFGRAMGLSSDGKRLVVGTEFYDGEDGSTEQSGIVKVYKRSETNNKWEQIGNDILGDKTENRFGSAAALSADGNIFVASGLLYKGNSTGLNPQPNTGYVRAYKYNNSTNEWLKLGNDMVSFKQSDGFGYSVSTSENGMVVAVGIYKGDSNGRDSGETRVFSFNYTDENWHQMGQNITGEATRDFAGFSVSLSRNGTRLAIGSDWNDGEYLDPIDSVVKVSQNSGSTRVYEYVSDEWKQLGQDIDGEHANDYAGRSVSLSLDGTTLAVGSVQNSDAGKHAGSARVFVYNQNTKEWNQLGQDIDGKNAGDEFGMSVSISENGSILAVGAHKNSDLSYLAGHVRVFHYVERIQQWRQIGEDLVGLAENDRFGRSVAISKDGSKLAVASPDHANAKGPRVGNVRVFEFTTTLSDDDAKNITEGKCDIHQLEFRLELESDKFPEDIEWALFNAAGNFISIEDVRLLPNVDQYQGKRLPDRTECIHNKNSSVFLIVDRFGDGLCCDWGKGSFSVFVGDDEKPVLTSKQKNFTNQASICLPLDDEIQPFSLDIILDDHPASSWWILYDSTAKKKINDITNYQGKEKFSEVRWATCVRKQNCLTFVMGDNNLDMEGFNGFKEGSGYELYLDDQLVKPRTYRFNSTDIVRIGDSCAPQSDHVIVQIIIYAGFTTKEMSWALFDVKDPSKNLLEGNELDTMTGSYHEKEVHFDSCLIFRMQNSMDASITILWDGNVIYDGHREFHPITLIRIGDSCSQCPQGSKLLQFTAQVLDPKETFIWQVSSNGERILSTLNAPVPAPYNETCVPDQCLTLVTLGNGVTTYQFFWGGDLLKFVPKEKKTEDIAKFGTCTECSNGESLLEILINNGRYVDKVSWSIGTKNNTKAIFNQRPTVDRDENKSLKNSYFRKCVNATKCLYLSLNTVCHGDTCLRMRLRQDRKILEDIFLNTTVAKIQNKQINSADSNCVDE